MCPSAAMASSFYFLRTYPGKRHCRAPLRDRSTDRTTACFGPPTRLRSVERGPSGRRMASICRPIPNGSSSTGLATNRRWARIPTASIGAPVLSPGGGLMAYSAGDQVIVAWTTEPGAAVATAPFARRGGYAFATSGEEIVISDGSSLHVISYDGDGSGHARRNSANRRGATGSATRSTTCRLAKMPL